MLAASAIAGGRKAVGRDRHFPVLYMSLRHSFLVAETHILQDCRGSLDLVKVMESIQAEECTLPVQSKGDDLRAEAHIHRHSSRPVERSLLDCRV